jgi:hypothetical protein
MSTYTKGGNYVNSPMYVCTRLANAENSKTPKWWKPRFARSVEPFALGDENPAKKQRKDSQVIPTTRSASVLPDELFELVSEFAGGRASNSLASSPKRFYHLRDTQIGIVNIEQLNEWMDSY